MQNKEFYNEYIQAFLKQNAKLNLISKNDEKFLWEKHIFDSLSIERYFDKYKKGKTMLDIGTGGGFPALPVAYTYKDIDVYPLDSIRKKINAINEMKDELNLENVFPICERAEKLSQKFDLITSRAVAPLKVISGYALPLLKKDGYFVAFKSVKAQEEIDDAKLILKKFNAKVIDIIEYDLPLEENHTRNLIVIKQQQ
ncbi:TPA: 16S rRNA (guanine(527)-N(7))-methyltransferase RsmG [Candidatus Gastranaerophilales bacterium HUM_20]|nr:ribosomal RNA small subunit methyltransferase G [Clostridium sp. CAG:729]DAB22688.1 MAG TPA: 16S rRNA (guanine(527)-N(7))-methyltransferase RsmG [Candidatus Gastranaerophilales bacterium HUM_20]